MVALRYCSIAFLQGGIGEATKDAHKQLHQGDIVQAFLKDGFDRKRVLAFSISAFKAFRFSVTSGFLQCSFDASWAFVRQHTNLSLSSVNQLSNYNENMFVEVETATFCDSLHQADGFYLEMVNSFRKVGIEHNCKHKARCKFSFLTRQFGHSRYSLSGNRFFLLTRTMTYPSRWSG